MEDPLLSYIPVPALLVQLNDNSIAQFNSKALEWSGVDTSMIGESILPHLPSEYLNVGEYTPINITLFGINYNNIKLTVKKHTQDSKDCFIVSFYSLQSEYKDYFREMFLGVQDGIILVDKKLRIVDVNPTFCQITDLNQKDVIDKNALFLARHFLNSKSLLKTMQAIEKVIRNKPVPAYEIMYKNKVLSISASIKKNSPYFIASLRDMSKTQEARKKLEESEHHHRTLIESLTDYIFVIQNQKIKFVNKHLILASGHKEKDILGAPFYQFVVEEERERVMKFYTDRLEGKDTPQFYMSKAKSKNGDIIDVEVSIIKINYDNEPAEMIVLKNITQQKKTLESLKESESNFRMLADNAFDGILINDINGKYLYANKQALNISGYSLEELLKKSANDLTPIHLQETLSKNLAGQFKEGQDVSNLEFSLLAKGNKEIPIEVTASKSIWQNKPTQMVTIRDISKRKQAEKEKQQVETKFQELANLLPEIIFETDNKLNLTFVNQAVNNRLNLSPEDLTSNKVSLASIIHDDDREKLFDSAKNNISGKISSGNIYKAQLINGDIRYFQIYNSAIKQDDKTIGLRGIAVDITDRKKAELEIVESEKLLDTILDNIPGGFLLIDKNFTIIRVNNITCEITGFNKEELLGQKCETVCSTYNGKENCPVWKNKDKAISGHDTMIKCKGNTQIPILKNAKTIQFKGEPYILESFIDIREQKENEQKLIDAKKKAEDADRLKSAFLANMSHEIRTPMNGILGFTSLLKNRQLTEEKQQYFLETIEKSGFRLMNTVNDIIEISKIEANETPLNKKLINIHEVLFDIWVFFKLEAESKDLQLKYYPEDELFTCTTDQTKIESIITNLIKNAIKFSDKGTIQFGFRVENNHLFFFCKDEGDGIDGKRQKAIFNRFEQADIEDSKAKQGTGLGLTITKAYTEMLGGTIEVNSALGKGTSFYVHIPI